MIDPTQDDQRETAQSDAAQSDIDSAASAAHIELSADDVRHLASLARIGMTDDEVQKFRTDLSSILDHFDVLAAIDTEGVEPTNNGADLLNVMVADKSRASATHEQTMANAPTSEDAYFRVRAVLD